MLELIATLEEKGFGYRARERRRQLRGAQVPRLRQAVGQVDRPAARRRARRGARRQGRSARLRDVEGGQGRASPTTPSGRATYGPGRPGWHIECSAMCKALLGEHFDIHGGGQDLQFPHHENEIAQSEAASGGRFANVWMHNGLLNIDNEKMSKSLGNFFTIRDVLKRYDGETIRFFMLRTHYRSPVNFSDAEPRRRARRAAPPLHRARRGRCAGDAGRARLERAARRRLPRGDERRLQHADRRRRCCSSSPAEVNRGGPTRGRPAAQGAGARPRHPAAGAARLPAGGQRRSTRRPSPQRIEERAAAKKARDYRARRRDPRRAGRRRASSSRTPPPAPPG